MIQKIQKFGAAMLAPVLLFAFSGMIVGISVLFTNQQIFGSLAAEGTLWLQFWTIVNKGAWTVFNQMPLLFVVGLPIGLAKKEQARCCMEALVLYLTFNYFVNQILTYWGSYVGIAMDSTAKTSGLTSVAGIRTLDTGCSAPSSLLALLSGCITGSMKPNCRNALRSSAVPALSA